MTTVQVNLVISLALIVAIVGAVLAGVVNLFVHGVWDSKFTDVIIALNGLLLAFRHVNDVRAGNGASGLTPPKE